MAERHPCAVMNLVEYQGKLQLAHTEKELPIFGAVLKPCKKNPKFLVHHSYYVFSLPSLSNDPL